MPRRTRSSPLDDIVDFVARFPWWVGVISAAVSYVVLSSFASKPVAINLQPGAAAGSVVTGLFKTLATFLQYLIPAACLFGAGLSAWGRHKRRALAESVTASESADVLNGMTWQAFEQLVGEAFRQRGYQVTESGGGGSDGGVDLVVVRQGDRHLVQCKQWRAYRVGVEVVRELYGAMAAQGAAGGFVITSGRFTDPARQFAEGRNIELVDGAQLHRWFRDARDPAKQSLGRAVKPTSASVNRSTDTPSPQTAEATMDEASSPNCPMCSKPMIKRVTRRGARSGAEFWGCSGYPACKATRPLES